jgi:hypothetical protein
VPWTINTDNNKVWQLIMDGGSDERLQIKTKLFGKFHVAGLKDSNHSAYEISLLYSRNIMRPNEILVLTGNLKTWSQIHEGTWSHTAANGNRKRSIPKFHPLQRGGPVFINAEPDEATEKGFVHPPTWKALLIILSFHYW